MNALPLTDEIQALARRLIWFEMVRARCRHSLAGPGHGILG